MSIKRKTRSAIRGGSKTSGTVVERYSNYASVKLVGQGTIISGIAVASPDIKVGDSVIIDYTDDYRPVVRPISITPAIIESTLDVAPYVKPKDESPFKPPIPNTILTPSWYPILGKAIRVGSPQLISSQYVGQFGGAMGYWVEFNYTVFDSDNQYNTIPESPNAAAYNGGTYFKCKIPGKYFFRSTIAIQCDNPQIRGMTSSITIGAGLSGFYDYISRSEIIELQDIPHQTAIVATTSSICAIPLNYYVRQRILIDPIVPYPGSVGSIPLIIQNGRYPVFEWWRIAPNIGAGSEYLAFWS